MLGLLHELAGSKCLLIAAAAPIEAAAILQGLRGSAAAPENHAWMLVQAVSGVDLVLTGIGKANAAGAVAHVLDPDRHAAVLSLGIGGALPGADEAGVRLGSVVCASASVFADEGLLSPSGFTDCFGLGFPLGDFQGSDVPVNAAWAAKLARACSATGRIATVSTCSGTDAAARIIADRTGAIVEAMEGAAVGLVCHRLRVPFAEVRVVSNTTGDRERQRWDIKGAMKRLEELTAAIHSE